MVYTKTTNKYTQTLKSPGEVLKEKLGTKYNGEDIHNQ